MIQKAREIALTILAAALLMGTVNAVAMDSQQSFTDVPSTHWAYGSIQTMTDMGIVGDVGGSKFGPSGKVSPTQFADMVARVFCTEGQDEHKPSGVDTMTRVANWGIPTSRTVMTRADMARFLSYLMDQQGVPTPSTTELGEVKTKIADYDKVAPGYQDAVAVVYCHGVMKGVDTKGSFNPNGPLTRAEACVVLERLMRLIEESKLTVTEPSQQVELRDVDVPKDENPIEEAYLANGAPITEENIKAILERVRENYPEGMAWGWTKNQKLYFYNFWFLYPLIYLNLELANFRKYSWLI